MYSQNRHLTLVLSLHPLAADLAHRRRANQQGLETTMSTVLAIILAITNFAECTVESVTSTTDDPAYGCNGGWQ